MVHRPRRGALRDAGRASGKQVSPGPTSYGPSALTRNHPSGATGSRDEDTPSPTMSLAGSWKAAPRTFPLAKTLARVAPVRLRRRFLDFCRGFEYAGALFREPITPASAMAAVQARLANRTGTFLDTVGVQARRPRGPQRPGGLRPVPGRERSQGPGFSHLPTRPPSVNSGIM